MMNLSLTMTGTCEIAIEAGGLKNPRLPPVRDGIPPKPKQKQTQTQKRGIMRSSRPPAIVMALMRTCFFRICVRGGLHGREIMRYDAGITGGRLMADWNRIKTEYITTDTSYRELSQKYGVHYTNIAKRAKKEDWQQLRQQQTNTTQTKMIQAVERRKVDRAAKLIGVSDLLLDKVRGMLEDDSGTITSQAMRNLSGVLRDIKDIQMIRSDADMREQEARIDKLRREAARDEDDGSRAVVVNIGGDGAWQK